MASKSPEPEQEGMQAPPYRQIRADYTADTITVYQAYSPSIALPALSAQKLNASPSFSLTRMTWIKPSWSWMLYRSGYSYKDARQTHILALKLKQTTFISLLRNAVLSHGGSVKKAEAEGRGRGESVRVQWDPERSVRMEKLEYRSIQIGIPGAFVPEFLEGIVGIEDVSERARELKSALGEDLDRRVGMEELVEMGLVPVEREFVVDEVLREILGMGGTEGE